MLEVNILYIFSHLVVIELNKNGGSSSIQRLSILGEKMMTAMSRKKPDYSGESLRRGRTECP
jgi:hypothetical protein